MTDVKLRKHPIGTKIKLLEDITDRDDGDSNERIVARAGEIGVITVTHRTWPTITIDGKREVVVDMESEEGEVVDAD